MKNHTSLLIASLILLATGALTAWAQSPTASSKSATTALGIASGANTSESTQIGVVDQIDGPFLVVAWYDRQGFAKALDTGQGITDAIITKTRHIPLSSIIAVERPGHPGHPDPAQLRGSVYYKGPFGQTEEALIVDLLANPNTTQPDNDLASIILDHWSLWLTQNTP